jgi:hypothetical protein
MRSDFRAVVMSPRSQNRNLCGIQLVITRTESGKGLLFRQCNLAQDTREAPIAFSRACKPS